jgi:O-acetyl-ADP-ribose deacetylase (regulator of RNase III)
MTKYNDNKIKYKVGDLTEALKSGEVSVIGHQANCFCTMNSGVAKAIKMEFPDAWYADQETEKGDVGKFGDCSVGVHDRDDGSCGLIYNLYGQYNYGYDAKGYTDYGKLEEALTHMRNDILTATQYQPNYFKVGFPKIGAGLGGGDWDTIAEIVDSVFDERFTVTVYVLREEDLC